MTRHLEPTRGARHGMALPAVLALLAAVAMLVLAYATLAMANWLSARNLREGVHAWARAESVAAAVVGELGAAYGRTGSLPDTYAFDAGEDLDATVAYLKTGPATARVDVVAHMRHVAARRVLELDLAR